MTTHRRNLEDENERVLSAILDALVTDEDDDERLARLDDEADDERIRRDMRNEVQRGVRATSGPAILVR